MASQERKGSLRVGLSGHQDLGSNAHRNEILEKLGLVIESLNLTEGFTCLAAGADQSFAAKLRQLKIPYTVIIPCRDYETTFQDKETRTKFFSLLKSAESVKTLEFDAPCEEAFYAAGMNVVESTDVLIAIWDGKPAKGLGGTGDMVEFANSLGKPVIHIHSETFEVAEL